MSGRRELATEDAIFGGKVAPVATRATHRELLLVGGPGHILAIPITAIEEVTRLPRHITRVPGAPPSLIGLAKWRARVVPVVDLGLGAGRDASLTGPPPPLILVPFEDGRVGFVVERILGTCRVPEGAIVEPSPEVAAASGLDVVSVLELVPERLDEASHVPPSVRERCRLPIVDLDGALRRLAARMPARFPGAHAE
ncbi:MAG: chemotaxis protein CheW [Deltaproteobacteria bacterium]|nr:chemotaxis protein CheW [Deltaproteobacteria bacterium]